MRSHSSIDGRLKLSPQEYFSPPQAFGVDPAAVPFVPPGGDVESLRVALLQHRLFCQYRAMPRPRPSGAAIGRQMGFSKSVFSRSATGRQWAGATVIAGADGDPPAAAMSSGGRHRRTYGR